MSDKGCACGCHKPEHGNKAQTDGCSVCTDWRCDDPIGGYYSRWHNGKCIAVAAT